MYQCVWCKKSSFTIRNEHNKIDVISNTHIQTKQTVYKCVTSHNIWSKMPIIKKDPKK